MKVVEHVFEPYGAAKEMFESRASELLLSGPAGTGKSRACLEKLHVQALKYPGMRAVMLRKTQTSLGSTGLVTFREKVAVEAIENGTVRWYGGSQQEAAAYKYSNGSVINIGGMDKPTKIMSSEYDVAFVQEAVELTETDWEAITTRLRNGRMPYQQLIADCNPDAPTHWLKIRAEQGTTRLLESRHEDNPVYFNRDGTMTPSGAAYIEGKLDKLTGVRYYRLRKGLWVAAEGVIFEDWDPAIHLIDPFPIPDNWVRWWVVDFGFTNPFVLQCWAEDPDGRLYLYRELYRTQRTVDQHAIDILNEVATEDPKQPGRWIWHEPKPRAIICDHDAEGRVVLSTRVGIGTIPAKKGVADGIQAGQRRMKVADDGKPRMYIMRNACVSRDQALVDAKRPTCTEEEIPSYIWEPVGPGSASKAPKERPLKENDHGADCYRYLSADREIGAPRMRSM